MSFKLVNIILISIHAPSRERRLKHMDIWAIVVFQSTLPRGSDVTSRLEELGLKQFQSTLPRGSDRLV